VERTPKLVVVEHRAIQVFRAWVACVRWAHRALDQALEQALDPERCRVRVGTSGSHAVVPSHATQALCAVAEHVPLRRWARVPDPEQDLEAVMVAQGQDQERDPDLRAVAAAMVRRVVVQQHAMPDLRARWACVVLRREHPVEAWTNHAAECRHVSQDLLATPCADVLHPEHPCVAAMDNGAAQECHHAPTRRFSAWVVCAIGATVRARRV
jgi:hypothetical protein